MTGMFEPIDVDLQYRSNGIRSIQQVSIHKINDRIKILLDGALCEISLHPNDALKLANILEMGSK